MRLLSVKNVKQFFAKMKTLVLSVILFQILLIGVLQCAEEQQSIDQHIKTLKLQALPEVVHPSSNPYAIDKVNLGKLLFYDPILSGERDISCYTCHIPSIGYSDGISLSVGPGGQGLSGNRVAGAGRPIAIRNSTSIVNGGYVGLANSTQNLDVHNAPMTWTIVRRSLEAQTFGALGNSTHMKGNGNYEPLMAPDSIAARLKKIPTYVALFSQAFGGGASSVTRENLGKAIATFERTLVSKNSAYDQYVTGDLDALTSQQKEGLVLYFGKANCSTCHGGPMFSDYSLYNLGIQDNPLLPIPDLGNNNLRLFRTPSLRNAALTAPYMHNGTIATLRDVIDFYNKGKSENPEVPASDLSVKIKPLRLSEHEITALVAFLEALTDESYDQEIPESVPSGLRVGGY
jgi:cytochrome c peroxidase